MMQKHSRAHIHVTRTLGERAADALAAAVGSWRFVIWQNVFVIAWITFNAVALLGFHADPYPFILLNLLFSWQASNTGPILQLSSNRQAAKDRLRDDTEAAEVEQLFGINREQLEILQGLRDVKAVLQQHTTLLCELLPERPTMVLPALGADAGEQKAS